MNQFCAWTFSLAHFPEKWTFILAWEIISAAASEHILYFGMETWVAEVLVAYWASDPWFLPLRCFQHTQIRAARSHSKSRLVMRPRPNAPPLLILYPSRPEFLTSACIWQSFVLSIWKWIINPPAPRIYVLYMDDAEGNNRINGRLISLVLLMVIWRFVWFWEGSRLKSLNYTPQCNHSAR